MATDTSSSRENIVHFLKNNPVGVLATATTSGKPHAATVYITFDQDLNIYFVTRKGTRKSQNLHTNNQAAIAIYNAASQTTLQVEGAAIEVADPQKVQWVFNDIWHIASQTSPGTPPPQTQLTGAGDYVAYHLLAPSLRLATYTKGSNIFDVIPTQGDAHFNAYGKR